jgi:hypothetical protein
LHPLTGRCPREFFNPIHGFRASRSGAVPLTIPNSSAHDLFHWSRSSSSPTRVFSVFPFGLPGISHSRGRLPPFRFQSLLLPSASRLKKCRPHGPRSRYPAALKKALWLATRPVIPYRVFNHPKVDSLARRPTRPPLIRFPCSTESLSVSRTGYLVPRFPFSVAKAHSWGLPAHACPRLPKKTVHPLSSFGPFPETLPRAAQSFCSGKPKRRNELLS